MTYIRKDLLELTVWIIFLQAFEMVLSNFNRLEAGEHDNAEGLNMLHTVFSIIFLIYNTFIGNLIIENKKVSYTMSGFLWLSNIMIVLFTTFSFD